ncbi:MULTISPECIES: PaaI family thioesterase [Paraburkholderia]|uniref:PaaI family thioesterase n=1 Tax=Paraburkholderia madseniana TaxID=2599607 RepID=A0AAP5BP51_9BURK|nr:MULTISPECIES: PaaI family thioesterase [Paraburkholderia]MCX4151546.1 PaaI family thioesterase [Paraburkholderia madseniana]MDN7154477.1 PaaI family thioesterase [Paraburkholderia sp. WS6]MDQ6413359.1 PaaI family thioesterase [Paraburkholderia madseniana]
MPEALDTTAQWLHDEELVGSRLATTKALEGKPDAASAAEQLDGLTIVMRMLTGEIPQAAMCETLNYVLIDAAYGRALFQGRPRDAFTNPHLTMHGGWSATLLDSAMGCAVRTVLPAGRVYTTMDLTVRFIKAVSKKVTVLRAEGTVVHAGRRAIVAEGRLFGPDGTLYAMSSGSCITLPSEA